MFSISNLLAAASGQNPPSVKSENSENPEKQNPEKADSLSELIFPTCSTAGQVGQPPMGDLPPMFWMNPGAGLTLNSESNHGSFEQYLMLARRSCKSMLRFRKSSGEELKLSFKVEKITDTVSAEIIFQ